jgi:hypothetical protein
VFGGVLGQRPKIFREKIYGSHSPPLVTVSGPSEAGVDSFATGSNAGEPSPSALGQGISGGGSEYAPRRAAQSDHFFFVSMVDRALWSS